MRCWPLPRRARRPVAARPCSRSATNRSLRYPQAREELKKLGHSTTLSYLREMCALVLRHTRLLPHVNPGLMNGGELNALREVSVSQGIMLESVAQRLCERGGPHYGSPDKAPNLRLATIEAAGIAKVPFTSGDTHWDRRDPRGETRGAALTSRLASTPWPYPGSDHPELSGQG